MARRDEFSGSISQQLCRPTRPLHAHDIKTDYSRAAETTFSDQYFDAFSDFEEDRTTESEVETAFAGNENEDVGGDDPLKILREYLGELDEEVHEKFGKLVSKVGKEVPIERLLHEFKGLSISDMLEKLHKKLNRVGGKGPAEVMERGIDADVLKLERFKVKTLNIIGSGDVKEEEELK